MPNPWPHQRKAACWFQLALIMVLMGRYAHGVRLPAVVWSFKMSLGSGCGSSHGV